MNCHIKEFGQTNPKFDEKIDAKLKDFTQENFRFVEKKDFTHAKYQESCHIMQYIFSIKHWQVYKTSI